MRSRTTNRPVAESAAVVPFGDTVLKTRRILRCRHKDSPAAAAASSSSPLLPSRTSCALKSEMPPQKHALLQVKQTASSLERGITPTAAVEVTPKGNMSVLDEGS